MKDNIKPVMDMWKEEISDHIKEYAPYQVSQQLKQMASLFVPGSFYYYILNFHNLDFDFVDGDTHKILGIAPNELTMEKLLSMLPPEELSKLREKEVFTTDFLFRFLKPEELPYYKVIYFFKLKDTSGTVHHILHQACTMTVSDTGKVEHVLGIQTDVSHLKMSNSHRVSFISTSGGTSYYNLDPEKGYFNPEDSEPQLGNFKDILTKRETEVVSLLAKGLNTEEMADELNISFNTIYTHRKNILRKTGCNNTAELTARCVIEGVI